MTAYANRSRTAQHGRGGRFGGMSRMTDSAAGSELVIKQPAMRRLGKNLGLRSMTLAAHPGNTLWTCGGKRVFDRARIVDAMAIHALGCTLAPGGQQLAMDTGLVFGELIHTRLRLVFAHEIGVTVTSPAEFRDPLARDPDLETAARIHRYVLVSFIRIAAVTIGATDRLGKMDVVGELQTHPLHDTMTIKAGILADTGSAAQKRNQRKQQSLSLHKS